jgi:hypothetical protein
VLVWIQTEKTKVRRIEKLRQNRLARGRGMPKKIWMDVIKKYMSLLDLHENVTVDRNKSNERIYVNDHAKSGISSYSQPQVSWD